MYLHISHILKLQKGISDLNVSAGLKITLCGHNLNYGETKQSAIWQLELQKWTAKGNFPQSKRKRWKKKTAKKISKVWPRKLYPVGIEPITSRKTRNYNRKTKSIFDRKKWKKKRAVGRRNPRSQPVNNSLASFRHQRGRNSTDPRLASACTNSCG